MANARKSLCSTRIAQALAMRNMKQADLCAITGIPKSAMSQYIKGSFEPKQDRVFLMARALDVSEAWLMGYDVPIERQNNNSTDDTLTDGERMLLDLFNEVPEERRQMLLDMIRIAINKK